MSKPAPDLLALAARWGVEPGYHDIDGRWHDASADALVAVLSALGAPLARPADAAGALRAFDAAQTGQPVDPVGVAWCGRGGGIAVRADAALRDRGAARAEIACEDGSARACELPLAQAGDGADRLLLPGDLPPGRHRLRVHVGGAEREALVLAAPPRVPEASGRRWGLFAPLYAVRRADGAGAGDFAVLARLLALVARLGGTFVGSTPLLAMFVGRPCVPSPYAPISRLFWNELMIAPERTAEWSACGRARALWDDGPARAERTRLAARETIDWRAVRRAAEPVLRALADHARTRDAARRDEVLARARRWPECETFARFRAALDRHGADWRAWPESERRRELPGAPGDEDVFFHLWAQVTAEDQLAAARARTPGGAVAAPYLDLPVGSHPGGFDAWRWPELFAERAALGAPPDALFAGGQNWDFRPPIPRASRAEGHAHFAACLRHHLRHAGLVRIDHVMALHRLYWIPEGFPPTDGAYVRYPHDELYATVCLEATRAGVPVAGEDLGTVPDAVREALDRHGLLRSFVGQFAFRLAADGPFGDVPERSIATLNTHDTPTFAGFWHEVDLDAFEAIGCLPAERLAAMRAARRDLRARLPALLAARGLLGEADDAALDAILDALHRALAEGPARRVMVTLEDLWLETRPQNVPGTGFDRPNFRRPFARPLEEIERDPELARRLARIDAWRRGDG
ncbi:MAG: 4-alpha-glucanotransferase [Acidobacteriota bacterium]